MKISPDVLPLHEIVSAQMKLIGLSSRDLAQRCGYKNTDKGLRRLEALWGGDIWSEPSSRIITSLATILNVEPVIIQQAVDESRRRLRDSAIRSAAECEDKWRSAFRPHAFLLGTADEPSQITIFGATGGHQRWHKIEFDLSKSPATFPQQALNVVKNTPTTPFFGPTTGFIVNYSPDKAIRFDLDGAPIELFGQAYVPGEVSLKIGGRLIQACDFGRLIGTL